MSTEWIDYEIDEREESEPRFDIEGLLEQLDAWTKERMRITEVTYIINDWYLGGFIPLKHHGFVLKSEDPTGYAIYLTLDFGNRGIMWDLFDEFPDHPEGTCQVRQFRVCTDPAALKSYCKATKPWSLMGNDCARWSSGVMQALRVNENDGEEYAVVTTNGETEHSIGLPVRSVAAPTSNAISSFSSVDQHHYNAQVYAPGLLKCPSTCSIGPYSGCMVR